MILEEGALFADRYQLIKLLGRGGFSEVWLANDTKSGVDVALKVYAPYGGLDEHGNRLFSQEFSLVFNINQTNLLKPTYYDVYERSPYLILPYCGRGSTLDLVGKTDEKTLVDILHDVASGLAYLHAQEPPIIHQDIKPDNILINDHGDYVITDFGISTKIRSTLRQSAMSQEQHSGGTYAYMAPERFSKTPMPVRASDIWSLGAMAYELLDGNPPFDTMGGVMQKNGAEIPEIRADISDTVKNIVYACVAAETWDRPTAETIVEWTSKLRAGESLNLGGKEKKGRINNLFKQTIMRDGSKTRGQKPQKAEREEEPAPVPEQQAPVAVPPKPQVRSFIEDAKPSKGAKSSHGSSHGNSHGSSNGGKNTGKKIKPGLLYGIIGGVVAIAAIIIGIMVANNKQKEREAQEALAKEKERLENMIFDDFAYPDRDFPYKDPETGAMLHSAKSLFADAIEQLESPLYAQDGLALLNRVSDADYASSANATALLSYLYANKDVVRLDEEHNPVLDEEGQPIYLLDPLYRSIGAGFKVNVEPNLVKAHRYSQKALEQDVTCYRAHYELALDYLWGSDFHRSDVLRNMFKLTVHVFRGKKYAKEKNNAQYMQLFDNLYKNLNINWAEIIADGKQTQLKQEELEDIWADLMEELKRK